MGKLRTTKHRRGFCNYSLRPAPIIAACLLLLIVGVMPIAGQLVTIPFAVRPLGPRADQPLIFSFDASRVKGKVVGIVIFAGSGCSATAMIVTMLDVSPAVASGSVSLHSGLGIGQYSAIAFILTHGPGQSTTEITSCLPFAIY